jgi:hypothetical protein
MDSENKFWLSLWTMVAVSFLIVCTNATYSSHLEDSKLVQMVQAGADPIKAKCALSMTSNRSLCDVVVSK